MSLISRHNLALHLLLNIWEFKLLYFKTMFCLIQCQQHTRSAIKSLKTPTWSLLLILTSTNELKADNKASFYLPLVTSKWNSSVKTRPNTYSNKRQLNWPIICLSANFIHAPSLRKSLNTITTSLCPVTLISRCHIKDKQNEHFTLWLRRAADLTKRQHTSITWNWTSATHSQATGGHLEMVGVG
jgi:hypothetical protein